MARIYEFPVQSVSHWPAVADCILELELVRSLSDQQRAELLQMMREDWMQYFESGTVELPPLSLHFEPGKESEAAEAVRREMDARVQSAITQVWKRMLGLVSVIAIERALRIGAGR